MRLSLGSEDQVVFRLRLLGSPDLTRPDGAQVLSVLAQPKRLALLAYLVADSARHHSRDELIGVFWPDSDEDDAHNSLRQALHYLRRSLADGVIITRGDGEIGVDHDLIECDVVQFEVCVASQDLETALELYRGDLGEDLYVGGCPEFDHWRDGRAATLRGSAVEAAATLASRREEEGDLPAAVEFARRALELAPSDESHVRTLMRLLASSGDRAAAVVTYEVFERRFRVELELEPSAETMSLLREIREAPVEVEVTTVVAEAPSGTPQVTSPIAPVRRATWTMRRRTTAALTTLVGVTAALVTGLGRSDPVDPAAMDSQAAGVATAELIDPNSIVVLPFRDMSADGDQVYMSDGIAEELLNLLAQIPELKVISRTSAFSFKDSDLSLPEIAAELGVAHVLEGSVRKAGNTIRITAQLIEAQSDVNLFSESYDRPLDDIFAVQDEIAAKVVSELRLTLLGELPTLRETDPEAYTLFLQARQIAHGRSEDRHETVIPMLERVLEIAPNYAPAYLELALAYAVQADRPPEEGRQMRLEAIQHALSLDPEFAYARALLGMMTFARGDRAAGAMHVERALEMAPGDAEVLYLAGRMLFMLGRWGEALPVFEYARDRNPLYLGNLGFLAQVYWLEGRWEDAVATGRTHLALDPSSPSAHGTISWALLELGNLEEALAEAELEPDPVNHLQSVVFALHALGRQEEFERAFRQLREEYGESDPLWVVETYAHIGDIDAAFEWLDRLTPVPLVVVQPDLRTLHDDPRWNAWVERMEPSLEELAAIPFEVRLPR